MEQDERERMKRAYQISGGVMREELRSEPTDDVRQLDEVVVGSRQKKEVRS